MIDFIIVGTLVIASGANAFSASYHFRLGQNEDGTLHTLAGIGEGIAGAALLIRFFVIN